MSLIDSALNAISEVAKLVPGLGTAVSAVTDLVREIWNIAQPIVSSLADSVTSQVTKDWPAEQQNWAQNAVDGIFG